MDIYITFLYNIYIYICKLYIYTFLFMLDLCAFQELSGSMKKQITAAIQKRLDNKKTLLTSFHINKSLLVSIYTPSNNKDKK